jgi:hypothetical protein
MAWTFYNSSGEAMIIDGGLANVVEDTTPQLGANLDMNDFGLAFPATQSADAGANVLDDYEEGTWTPGISDSSLDPEGDDKSQGYDTNVTTGHYTRVGRLVTFTGQIGMTSLGTMTETNTASIVGLPFTSKNVTSYVASVHFGNATGLAIGDNHSISGQINLNTAYISMKEWDSTVGVASAMLISQLSADGTMEFSGHYVV